LIVMQTDTSRQLLTEWHDRGICILRMNRPHAYNALSTELVSEMRTAVAGIWNAGGRVMVLAASRPGFCAGADLKQRRGMTDEEKYAHNRAINALGNEIAALPLPSIAAINGVAMGGGCELSLACDIRYAAKDAVIGLTETRIGALPGAGGTQRLPRLIGTARALEMMFSGEPVGAGRAAEFGLINEVTEPEELETRVLQLAQRLASRSRRTAGLLKRVVYDGIEVGLAEGLELERVAVVEVLESDDYKEGINAFAEKRQPKFL
jgi:enoyl-CoA hydratase/carnithine racemase